MTGSAGDWTESFWAHVLYVCGLIGLFLLIPEKTFGEFSRPALLFVGVIGFWRYAWGLTHIVRAMIFRIRFPGMRRHAERLAEGGRVPHAFLLVTSFRISTETTMDVYRSVFRAAVAAPGGATVVASIVEMADQRLVTELFRVIVGENPQVTLKIVRCAGTGKRDALAYGFRAISREEPHPDDIVALIDGDTCVTEDLVARCAPFFSDPRVGALTTDELSEVRGAKVFHWWYSLRFAQRNILMGSMGLSRRVLTLTGRMSMYRASTICDPSFIAQVEFDYIDHWRLGRFKFLTGDDKSTWFWLLKNGYHMLYVPDVLVYTVEEPPEPNFFISARLLMTRWFGNMLRNNSRALALGPHRIGLFTWWTILDQRVSMWTTLTGAVFMGLGTVFVSPVVLLSYVLWILSSRYIYTLLMLTSRPRVSITYPVLLYFNQVYGSLIKTQVFFRLDKQKWTRQGTTINRGNITWRMRMRELSSSFMILLSWGLFITALATLMGLIRLSDVAFASHLTFGL